MAWRVVGVQHVSQHLARGRPHRRLPRPSPLTPPPEPRHPTRAPCTPPAQVFARCINTSPAKSKQFSKGISQLLDEGAVQQLRERGDQGGGGARSPLEPTRASRAHACHAARLRPPPCHAARLLTARLPAASLPPLGLNPGTCRRCAAPIVAAVGPLQFEVVQARMLSEYGVEVRLETIPYSCARWAMAGWDEVDAADADNQLYSVMQLEDAYGRPVLLFNAEWKMNKVIADSGEQLQLRPFAVAPDVEERRRK